MNVFGDLPRREIDSDEPARWGPADAAINALASRHFLNLAGQHQEIGQVFKIEFAMIQKRQEWVNTRGQADGVPCLCPIKRIAPQRISDRDDSLSLLIPDRQRKVPLELFDSVLAKCQVARQRQGRVVRLAFGQEFLRNARRQIGKHVVAVIKLTNQHTHDISMPACLYHSAGPARVETLDFHILAAIENAKTDVHGQLRSMKGGTCGSTSTYGAQGKCSEKNAQSLDLFQEYRNTGKNVWQRSG